jgi:peptidoglycan hydrolase CwlO-like protein
MINSDLAKRDKLKKLMAAGVIFLVLLSWIGSLDRQSTDYVDGAIVQSTLAFAAARATNAIVSTLQSTTITMQVMAGVSVTVGEVLDPINDLVEQYATLMKLSIASLVIQKILLEIVSDELFKILFTVSGALLMISFYLKRDTFIGVFFKTFVFLAFLRFILVVTVLLNGAVSARFIEPKTEQELAHLNGMEEQLELAQLASNSSSVSAEEQATLLASIAALESSVAEFEDELATVQERMAEIQADIDDVNGEMDASYTLVQQLNPFSADERLQRLQARVEELEEILAPEAARANQLNSLIEDSMSEISANQNTLAGRPDTLSEYVSGGLSSITNAVSLSNVVARVQEYVPSILNVMAYFMLQTLIMPLIFLYLLSYVS